MRRLSREIALQSLFQFDFSPELETESALTAVAEEHDPIRGKVALGYARDLLEGTLKNLKEIDVLLQQNLKGWDVQRLGGTERNILRICIYEMKFAREEERLEPAVAINEAVELSKVYCDDASPKFINGILGSISRQ